MSLFKSAIAIFGGTFDPVHFGHLRTALELYESLPLEEIRFVPCKNPVDKPPTIASVEQRLEMLRLAIADQSGFVLDDRELKRNTPSYMVETLESIRKEKGLTPICLICSMDTFQKLHTWHRWTELLNFAHIVVATRAGFRLPRHRLLCDLIKRHSVNNPELLTHQSSGFIYFQESSRLEISSTKIRRLLTIQGNPRYLLPEAVLEYIWMNKLYT